MTRAPGERPDRWNLTIGVFLLLYANKKCLRDSAGQKLASVHFEEEPGRRARA